MPPLGDLRSAVEAAAAALRGDDGAAATRPTLERPKRAEHGDYSTNAAMLLAPALRAAPRDIAGRLGTELEGTLGDALDSVAVAGPGFLNLVLSDAWHARALADVLAAGEAFGSGDAKGERTLLEFVSANPTGPLTAASGRHAAYGDALARILGFHGHDVSREYYFNDAGTQVRPLGPPRGPRPREEPVPDDGYSGDYVKELAAE